MKSVKFLVLASSLFLTSLGFSASQKRPDIMCVFPERPIPVKDIKFPEHWGELPKIQTRDYCQFPAPYDKSFGSSTVVKWILASQKKDKESQIEVVSSESTDVAQQVEVEAEEFKINGTKVPAHWGKPPLRQTRDRRPLPEPFGGFGSGTWRKWILEKQAEDRAASES